MMKRSCDPRRLLTRPFLRAASKGFVQLTPPDAATADPPRSVRETALPHLRRQPLDTHATSLVPSTCALAAVVTRVACVPPGGEQASGAPLPPRAMFHGRTVTLVRTMRGRGMRGLPAGSRGSGAED